MFLHWNATPEIFKLGPLQLRWYGLMFVLGFSIGYQGLVKICGWENKPTEKLNTLLTYLMVGTTVGARLGHCIFYDPVYYFSHPLNILKIWEGGLASHGGGIGVIIAIWLFCRKNPEFSLWWIFDRVAIFTVLTGAFIRIGNLMNSEIVGKPTDATWGVFFDRVDQVPRHPAQLYESFCYFIIAAVSWRLYLRFKEKTPRGLIFGFVLTAIFICRFVIEFFKEVQSPWEKNLPIDMGQILSIPFILIGLFLMWRSRRQKQP